MLNSLRQDVTQKLAQVRPLSKAEQDAMMAQFLAQQQQRQAQVTAPAKDAAAPEIAAPVALAGFVETDPSTWGNPSRNDSCPCGSGKKFKYCHGQIV